MADFKFTYNTPEGNFIVYNESLIYYVIRTIESGKYLDQENELTYNIMNAQIFAKKSNAEEAAKLVESKFGTETQVRKVKMMDLGEA